MDRSKEFSAIVERTEIPQKPTTKPSFYLSIWETETKIDRILEQLSRLTVYESFVSQPLLAQCSGLLKEYKGTQIDENVSRDYFEVVQNLKSMVKTKYLKYTLRFNELSRKHSKDRNKAARRDARNASQHIVDESSPSNSCGESRYPENREIGQNQELYFQQPEDQPLVENRREDYVEERRRIVNSITEIGQIVEDISIHVNLQEEQLKRIDDVLIKSDKWTRKALNELNDIWSIMKSNRSTMVRFFVFWVLVVLLFWFLRRI